MTNGIIIYGSCYGTARNYGIELGSRTGMKCVSYKEVSNIGGYDTVIYIGALYAGKVYGMKKTLAKLPLQEKQTFIIATVGAVDPAEEKNVEKIREALKTQLPQGLYEKACFHHLRGRIDYSGLNPIHKIMMKALQKSISKTPEEKMTEELRMMAESYNLNADFIDYKALDKIIEELQPADKIQG